MPKQPKWMERDAKTRKFRSKNDAPEYPESQTDTATITAEKSGAHIDKNGIVRGSKKSASSLRQQLEYIQHLARQTGDKSKFERARQIAMRYIGNIQNSDAYQEDDSRIAKQTWDNGHLSSADAQRNSVLREKRDARMYDRSTYAGNQSVNAIARRDQKRQQSSQFTRDDKDYIARHRDEINNGSQANNVP